MIRGLAVLATLACVLPASAQFSRWTSTPLEAAQALASTDAEGAPLVALRGNADPLRSLDAGVTWTPFTVSGKRPFDLQIAPTEPLTWYATAEGVVYRTRDGGATWEERSRGFPTFQGAPRVGHDADVLYLARFDAPSCGFLCTASTAHILTSSDGGRTWLDPNPQLAALSVAASPADARIAFALTTTGLVRSVDQGATWSPAPVPFSGLPDISLGLGEITLDRRDFAIAYVRPSLPFGGDLSAIFATRDGGATWTTVMQPPGYLVADPAGAGRVYLFADDGRLWESRDAGSAWAQVNAATDLAIARGANAVIVRDGERLALNAGAAKLRQLELADGALALGSDLWWNPSESGAGLTITHHSSTQTFVVWYAYDAAGAPVWRAVPGGQWSDRSFTGDLYETSGPAYFGTAFDPAQVVPRRVGAVTIRFDDENNAEFSYVLDGAGQGTKRITRQRFGPPATPVGGENFADLWWNEAQSGWGIGISHQFNKVFATWYVYDDTGKPLWVVMPDGNVSLAFLGAILRPVATGDLYTTRGPPSGAPFDPAQVVSTQVGTATLTFTSAGQATLAYTAFGRTESRTITRQLF